MKIVAASDTHTKHTGLCVPECDILIHAGDATFQGTVNELLNFSRWMGFQKAKYKIFIPGNHEMGLEKNWDFGCELLRNECKDLIILNDSGVTIDCVKIWGSPITPWFHDWAWNRRAQHIGRHWDMIPKDTNILVTHGPPYEILDELMNIDGTPKGEFVGCWQLRDKIKEIKPDIHIFGHIHSHGGKQVHKDGTSYYNASICDEMYMPTNPLTEIDYEIR